MRRAQLQFFEHLRRAHGLVGQLGVTTAGMDGPALMGLPTMYLTDAPNVRMRRVGRSGSRLPGGRARRRRTSRRSAARYGTGRPSRPALAPLCESAFRSALATRGSRWWARRLVARPPARRSDACAPGSGTRTGESSAPPPATSPARFRRRTTPGRAVRPCSRPPRRSAPPADDRGRRHSSRRQAGAVAGAAAAPRARAVPGRHTTRPARPGPLDCARPAPRCRPRVAGGDQHQDQGCQGRPPLAEDAGHPGVARGGIQGVGEKNAEQDGAEGGLTEEIRQRQGSPEPERGEGDHDVGQRKQQREGAAGVFFQRGDMRQNCSSADRLQVMDRRLSSEPGSRGRRSRRGDRRGSGSARLDAAQTRSRRPGPAWRIGRDNAEGAAGVEAPQRDCPGLPPLSQQQRDDQESADHEEQVDAQEAARRDRKRGVPGPEWCQTTAMIESARRPSSAPNNLVARYSACVARAFTRQQ